MGLEAPAGSVPLMSSPEHDSLRDLERKDSQLTQDSQTASEFIDSQLRLEADAREVLPYSFDTCTQPLGPLRQTVFACLTCSPPPASPAQVYNPAGICYSCSISCHGEHNLVELFSRRNFVCDCGSTRMLSTSPCTLRNDPVTGTRGVHSQPAASGNAYNQNFQNLFCGCGEEYDAHKEKGTMFQCLGLGTVESGGCGEDWWHPQCLMGLPRDWKPEQDAQVKDTKKESSKNGEEDEQSEEEASAPPGFPDEDDFESMLCYKCVESNPWIKQYAGTAGFLPALFKQDLKMDGAGPGETRLSLDEAAETLTVLSRKRPAPESEDKEEPTPRPSSPSKRLKNEPDPSSTSATTNPVPSLFAAPAKHTLLPPAPRGVFSLFLKPDFRDHLCRCHTCFPLLTPHSQLLDEEEIYEPPLSESGSEAGPRAGSGTRSHGTGSLLERGEAALSAMDRVRAIEGVMVYNHLRDKVKDFLKPYAESGRVVGAEDVKRYFEKLRGDEEAIRLAIQQRQESGEGGSGDNRREQSGY